MHDTLAYLISKNIKVKKDHIAGYRRSLLTYEITRKSVKQYTKVCDYQTAIFFKWEEQKEII